MFKVTASINANISDFANDEKDLKYNITITECKTSPMLSKFSPLCNIDCGYFLDSVKLKVVPIVKDSSNKVQLVMCNTPSKPQEPESQVKHLTSQGTSAGTQATIGVNGPVPKFDIQARIGKENT